MELCLDHGAVVGLVKKGLLLLRLVRSLSIISKVSICSFPTTFGVEIMVGFWWLKPQLLAHMLTSLLAMEEVGLDSICDQEYHLKNLPDTIFHFTPKKYRKAMKQCYIKWVKILFVGQLDQHYEYCLHWLFHLSLVTIKKYCVRRQDNIELYIIPISTKESSLVE